MVLASTASAAVLHAQTAAPTVLPVPPGARVRVTAPSLVGPLIANYLEMRGDTVVLVEDRAGQGLWSIPYNEIRSLHLSVGSKRNHGPYIVRGVVLGGGGGALLGMLFAATFEPSDSTKKFKRLTTGAVAGGIGAVVGGVIASRFSTENWSPIALGRRMSVLPSRNGAALRFDFTF